MTSTPNITPLLINARKTSNTIARLSDKTRSAVLTTLASIVEENIPQLLSANSLDLQKMSTDNPMYDRLQLTTQRLMDIAADLRHVATLACPLGQVIENRTLKNGIELRRVRVPFGVVGVIYEARPNVTFDVFSLCFKSGNVAVLKGGHDADNSNRAAIKLIHQALAAHNLSSDACTLLPSTHQATSQMLSAKGLIDVCIPRGGRNLIDFVRENAKIPVIETGAGVVHIYIDNDADIDMAAKIVNNAKTRRVSVCNALDTLLINQNIIDCLPQIVAPLAEKKVELHADQKAMEALRGNYPQALLIAAENTDKDREWMDYKMGIYTVDSLENALQHISQHGSGHSEAIVTENPEKAKIFQTNVDAACVYVNLPTSFTDGGQFELGAEIGISTQKLGPRGPMALKEITTTKYILTGNGQIRP